jgi:membrane-bound lytic murein transglycosylase D
VWPFLPKETRGYVPAFIAVNYVMSYSQEHNLYPTDPGIMADGVDSVTVHQPLHFDQLHEMLNIPMEDLKFFNPQYKAYIIPANEKNPMSLRLPEKYINSFIDNEKELYDFKTKKGIDREKLEEEMKKVSDRSVHIVKSGESLGSIAKKYRISVNQLKTWNNLKSTTIYPGQKLIVYSSGAPMAQAGNDKPVMRSTEQSIHIVKSGENLSLIAKKYKCSVTDLKEWNNLKSTNLSIGQKLKVYPPAEEKSSNVTTTTSDGIDKDQNIEGGKSATVTLLATPEQAELLAHYNSTTTVHFSLVYRGESKQSDAYIKAQDDYLMKNPIKNKSIVEEEDDNG